MKSACQSWTRTNTVRFNKPSCYFDTTWQWLAEPKPRRRLALPAGFTPASFRLEGGCLMCSATAAIWKWSERQDFHLRPRGPKQRALKTELRSEKMAEPKGVERSTPP